MSDGKVDSSSSSSSSANFDDLVAYEDPSDSSSSSDGDKGKKDVKKGSYVGIHSSGFRDFLLKSELLMAINDCGFEHPSEVQQECIPQALLGTDVICQAKSGLGKTAVFVLATLQQIQPEDGVVDTVVLAPTRELAYQICQEYLRFSKYLPDIKIKVFFGGIPVQEHRKLLNEQPHIVIGTPGRILDLTQSKHLKLEKVKRFIVDECDQVLDNLDMRKDVQAIFRMTPHEKQVMLFSATLSAEIKPICKKFTQHPVEIYVDSESKLTLHGLQQYFVDLNEAQKNRKLTDLLDALEFNQCVIFVNGIQRAKQLNKILQECNFPSMVIYGGLPQEDRLERYNKFKEHKARILVSTDIFGRGVDFERVNIVINYDMPTNADQYLHRVGRSGRFGTKGLAISFVSTDAPQLKKDGPTVSDSSILNQVQQRFEVAVKPLPDEIDVSTYMSA